MDKADLCNRLGIPLVKDKSELKAYWRKLVLKYHPDRNKAPDAEKAFITVQKLFEELAKSFDIPVMEYSNIRININPGTFFGGSTTANSFTWTYSS